MSAASGTAAARLAAAGLTRARLAPSQWAVLRNGTEVGRYGGREGARWAVLADGTPVTEGSPCSAGVVLGLLLAAIAEGSR